MKHPHAELMIEYAKDWAETQSPWQRWEIKIKESSWMPMSRHPYWDENYEYRRKPKPYEPTLLDQALELEIEAARLKANYYGDKIGGAFSIHANKFSTLRSLRTPAMIEHLKQQGKL